MSDTKVGWIIFEAFNCFMQTELVFIQNNEIHPCSTVITINSCHSPFSKNKHFVLLQRWSSVLHHEHEVRLKEYLIWGQLNVLYSCIKCVSVFFFFFLARGAVLTCGHVKVKTGTAGSDIAPRGFNLTSPSRMFFHLSLMSRRFSLKRLTNVYFCALSPLQGCQRIVEDWQRILMVRSLVISPHEDMRTWLKYASLCGKSGRLVSASVSDFCD